MPIHPFILLSCFFFRKKYTYLLQQQQQQQGHSQMQKKLFFSIFFQNLGFICGVMNLEVCSCMRREHTSLNPSLASLTDV